MLSLKNKILPQLFIIYTRYLIGGAFVFASLIKIKGNRFTRESGETYPIDTSWHLFETLYQSGIYWQFLGIGQLIAGGLLLTQRYSKLGAIINLPIIINVFVITISYDFGFTPVVTAGMLLANLLLIAWEWDELRILVNLPPIMDSKPRLENDINWQLTGAAIFLFTFTYRLLIDEYNSGFWFITCFLIGTLGLVIGLSRHKKRRVLLKN